MDIPPPGPQNLDHITNPKEGAGAEFENTWLKENLQVSVLRHDQHFKKKGIITKVNRILINSSERPSAEVQFAFGLPVLYYENELKQAFVNRHNRSRRSSIRNNPLQAMNPYLISMDGPGSNYYEQAEESDDELPNIHLPDIPYESYKIERQKIEQYCQERAMAVRKTNPGIHASDYEILMVQIPHIIEQYLFQKGDARDFETQYKMIFADYAYYIWTNHNADLELPQLEYYMSDIQDYFDYEGHNRKKYEEEQMMEMFGDMSVQSRLPTVIPRSRTVRDVVGRVAESKAPARSSAPQARRGGGRSRPSRQRSGS